MQDIRRSIGKNDLPFPKCFYASDDDGVIVLENLKTKGYLTVPKSAEGMILNFIHNCDTMWVLICIRLLDKLSYILRHSRRSTYQGAERNCTLPFNNLSLYSSIPRWNGGATKGRSGYVSK